MFVSAEHLLVAVPTGATCASACFLIFAAGATRVAAPDALIGVHSTSVRGQETPDTLAGYVDADSSDQIEEIADFTCSHASEEFRDDVGCGTPADCIEVRVQECLSLADTECMQPQKESLVRIQL